MGFFSKIWKSVKKIFRKVVKVVKKIAPYALAAGAILFTAGAALPALGIPSFAAATSGTLSALGINPSGMLASTLVNATAQAGYGAVIGGTVSALSGGSFLEGASAGALTGAVTGGITGALGFGIDPSAPVPNDALLAGDPAEFGGSGGTDPLVGAGSIEGAYTAGTGTSAPSSSQAPDASARGGLLGFWDEVKNSELAGGIAGGVIKGIGGALIGGANAEDRLAAARTDQDTVRLREAAATQRRRDAYLTPVGMPVTGAASLGVNPPTQGLLTARNRFGPGAITRVQGVA